MKQATTSDGEGEERAPEELERLEALDGRVLESTAERGEPAADAPHQQHRRERR